MAERERRAVEKTAREIIADLKIEKTGCYCHSCVLAARVLEVVRAVETYGAAVNSYEIMRMLDGKADAPLART